MRFMPGFMDKLQSALSTGFIGDNKTNGRVTVEPLWQLNSTPSIYGNSVRGPYRWFQDVNDSGVEWEVPNIKNISWDRQESQDLATCTITLYNMWHEGNLEQQELAGQLGKPGYFWPKRGLEVNRWNQLGGKGSLRKDGFWDPNFSWQNVLVQYALIRTYEGIGGNPTPENFTSVQDNLDDEHLVQTGTWLIDFVTAGSNGEMVLNCKDMGKLMLDQSCFPPIVPDGLYPLEYYPAGKSAFDSVFGAKPKTGVSPGSQGEVKSEYVASSADDFNEGFDVDIYGHKGSYAVDGNWLTSAWSEAHPLPAATVFWDFDILDPISKLSIKTWAGGYECYVSIMRDDEWLAGETIPGLSEPYLVKINIPFAIPDNNEPVINIELPDSFKNLGDTGYAQRVKISLRNLYYSGLADGFNFYRGGIRDLIFYREGAKVDPYTPDFATIPWTFSMCAHPTRGYWIIDDGGNVYGFGDAADYDSTAFGAVPLASRSGHDDNQSIAMCAHPDGKGYWVLDRMGHVYPYGSAEFYGEFEVPWPGTDKWGEDGLAAWDITPTHTGNGYWVCYGDGRIKGFGDATPNDVTLPWTSVGMFMNTFVNERYLYQHQANGITGHPTKMGFWVTTGSGEVYAFGDCAHYGQLDQRVYNPGMADTFRLSKTEYTKSIESTKSGNGYWIAFGSGHIAAYGDAVGQGPSYIYPQNNTGIDVPIDETNIIDWSFFRAIVWDMARDPDGTGFWVLVADGNVGSYSAEFWGSPGYQGLTGYRWHEGNFDGEYSSLIKELLGWAGFTLYNPSLGSNPPEIFGSIESTGIKTDTYISADKFDKRPIIDIVKELCEVVGYRFRIQEDGSIALGSPNIWRSGNFDIDGIRIYVDEDGNRVDADDPDAIEFIPMIDEEIDMFDYNTTLSSESMRSEIIIGNELPDPSNPSVTSFVRHTPRSGSELVAPGIPMLRGISRVGIWLSQLFTNQEEMRLMAELISLNAWFAERTASTTCVANPCLSVGDQIKLAERNTSEYNIHYITGISSNHDLDTGVWQYTLTTHWLGDADNWVITADASSAPVDGYHYIEISERVDRWQQERGFGLQKGAQANGAPESDNIIGFTGDFNKASTPVYVGTAPEPTVTTLYSMPDWEDGFSTTFPPPPQGGMTYVNEFYDLEDIYSLTHEIQIFNQTELDSNIYMQLYDGDCGDAGQYYGLQTLNNMIWSQFGTNDLYNVEPEAFTSTVSDSELGAPFIGLRRTFDALEPLKPGLYYVRVERDEYDSTSWADASYAYGGDWFSMYLTAPGHPEFLMGRMRFPREAAGVPASYHDNGGTWMEAWNNNNDDILYPVDYLHLATKSRANGQSAVSAVSHYSLMPNVDIWAEEPKAGWVHHLIGEGVVKGHDEGTLWDASTIVEQQNQVNKITWTHSGTQDAYRIYRGSNLNDLNMIQEIPGDDLKIYFNTAWQPTNAVVPGQTYLYGVSAVDDGGESAIGLLGDTGINTNDLWVFNGELVLKKAFNNLYFTIESRTAPLGDTSFLEIYNGANLVLNQEIKDINSSILLPTLGVDNTTTTYSFAVKGYPSATGNGYLKLNITENRNIDLSIVDTLLVTR